MTNKCKYCHGSGEYSGPDWTCMGPCIYCNGTGIAIETVIDEVKKFRIEILSDNVVAMIRAIMKDDPNIGKFDVHNDADGDLVMQASMLAAMGYIKESGMRFAQLFELVYEHYLAYNIWHLAGEGVYEISLDNDGNDVIRMKNAPN
jgi:hypothetical protein